MVFEGSDTTLTEDILGKPKEFIDTWIEWSAKNRSQVLVDTNSIADETETMFTVPNGERFWMTICSMMISCGGLDDSLISDLTIRNVGGGAEVDLIRLDIRNTNGNSSQTVVKTLNFNPPILVREGQFLQAKHNESAGASARSHFFIAGWREPKPIS